MSKKIQIQFTALVMIIVLAAMSRLIPHVQNFSPICALGLFGAAYFDRRWQAFLIPILATFLSDIFISRFIHTNHPFLYIGIEWQYVSYFFIVLAGFFIMKKVTFRNVVLGIFSSTAIFYLITNIGCWPGNPIYSQDFSGFITCLAAGLPFIKGTLIGNIFFTTLLFGGYSLLQSKFEILRPQLLRN